MNAIISLCHFCENHGPSIVFCTQPFHSQTSASDVFPSCVYREPIKPNDVGVTSRQSPNKCNPLADITSNSLDDSQAPDMAHFDDSQAPDIAMAYNQDTSEETDPQRLLGPNEGITPSKSEAKCEACRSLPPSLPGFTSNDVEANMRYVSGQHPSHTQLFAMVRRACLRSLCSEVSPDRDGPGPIFFGDDSSGYVLSHVFIIKDSQYSRGFQRRYSVIVVMMDKIFLLNSWPFLVRHLKAIIEELQAKALRVYEAEQAKSPARSHSVTPGGQRAPHLQAASHGPIAPSKPARSFVELTGDKHIFRKLHQTFTWLLKAGGNRLTEKLLEGPPTEDSIIDIENQEETEEGFVLVESKKDVGEDHLDEEMSGAESSGDFAEEPICPVFRNLRHLLRVFGYSKFHRVSHHVAIGNQIIIQGHQRKLVKSAIDCLKVLLPKGCCRVIYYSRCYEESWRCNFLGLSENVQIPQPVEPYVLVSIHQPDIPHTETLDDLTEVQDAISSMGLEDAAFSGYVFTVESSTTLPERGPTVLNKMEFVLMNDTLADSVVEQCIICLKEEWMNKVKVLFKFTRAGGSRSEEDTQGLLRVVGAEEDKNLLKFWREGLSIQYKKHMLTANHGSTSK